MLSRVADFDGDGRSDLLVGAEDDQQIFFADDAGGFRSAPVTSSLPTGDGCNNTFWNWMTADIDGDGRVDIVRQRLQTGETRCTGLGVALGNGDGSFRWSSILDDAGSFRLVATTDVNADGKADIILLDDTAPIVRVILGGDVPRPLEPQALACGKECTFNARGENGVADNADQSSGSDVDGDGIADVVLYTRSGLVVLFGAKDGVLREGPFSERRSERITATDVNGDGRADLLVNDDAFKATIALGRGDGTFDDVADRLAPVPYRVLRSVFADIDGDGHPDVVSTTAEDDLVLVLHRGNGDGTFEAPKFFASVGTRIASNVAPLRPSADGKQALAISVVDHQLASEKAGPSVDVVPVGCW